MKFSVISLFPDLIRSWSTTGLIGSAMKQSLATVDLVNPRDFATDKHRSVDDTAFGGSDGMVLKFEPMAKAIESVGAAHVAFLSPQGRPWDQESALRWQSVHAHVVLVCGRYAGFDHRLIEAYADEEVSVGDYILNGGEVASLSVMESVIRLIPGVLGNSQSAHRDSFAGGLLEPPSFTRPREIQGMSVPAPLLNGDHAEIARFERDMALIRTQVVRPDLIRRGGFEQECKAAWTRVRTLSAAELKALGIEGNDA